MAVRLHVPVIAALAFVVAACSSGSAPAAPADGSSERAPAIPGSPTASPAAPPPPASAPVGSATVTLRIDEEEHTIAGGACTLDRFPDGTFGFAVNAGTPTLGDGGPDYVGLVVVLPGDQADGTYDDVLLTASVGGSGFNVGDVSLTIRDGGTAGSFTGETRPGNRRVEGSFTC